MTIAKEGSIVDTDFIERVWNDAPEKCYGCQKDDKIVLRCVFMRAEGNVQHKQYCSDCAHDIELAKEQITDVTTTTTKKMRRFRPEKIEIRTTVIAPEAVRVNCGDLEIRPVPRDDGDRAPHYQVLVNGQEVASKEVSLHIGIDCLAEAQIVWLPDLSAWKG